jgi:hypothetical protein
MDRTEYGDNDDDDDDDSMDDNVGFRHLNGVLSGLTEYTIG